MLMVVDILGAEYTIYYKTNKEDSLLKNVDGYCDYTTKEIVVKEAKREVGDLGNFKRIKNRILRHELIHAFLYESGLWCNSYGVDKWAENEEMTDWIAIQYPKINKVFKLLGIDKE